MVFPDPHYAGQTDERAGSDPSLEEREILLDEKWPKMAFVVGRLAHDPTSWWVPSCVEAMPRWSGLDVIAQPGHEIYLREPTATDPSELHLRTSSDR